MPFIKDCSCHPLLGERHSAFLSASKEIGYIGNLGKGHFMYWNSTSVEIPSWDTASSCSPHTDLRRGASSCGVPHQAVGSCSPLWRWMMDFCRAAPSCVCVSAMLLVPFQSYSQGMGRAVG